PCLCTISRIVAPSLVAMISLTAIRRRRFLCCGKLGESFQSLERSCAKDNNSPFTSLVMGASLDLSPSLSQLTGQSRIAPVLEDLMPSAPVSDRQLGPEQKVWTFRSRDCESH